MNWNTPEKESLIEAVLTLRSPDEARRFLRDLMTKGEIEEFSKRLTAAEMLSEKVPYTTIQRQTGQSSTTVARIAKWLNGDLGGYRLVINRMHHHNYPTHEKGS
jgi:TrpR-related protein YerC/YecD